MEKVRKEFEFGARRRNILSVPFRESAVKMGYPPLPRSIGINDLASKLEVIYGAQCFRGKILSLLGLAVRILTAKSLGHSKPTASAWTMIC